MVGRKGRAWKYLVKVKVLDGHRDNLSQLTRLWKLFGEVHGWQKSAVGCKRREGLAIVELKQSGLDILPHDE